MDLLDFTYDEMEATFRHKRRSAITKLWSYTKQIKDPYRPKYYTKIELFVPQPTFMSPFPCFIVSIRNAKFKTFFRMLDLSELEQVFVLPASDKENALDALQNAKKQADIIENDLRDLIARKRLPAAIRGALKVNPETGEILAD